MNQVMWKREVSKKHVQETMKDTAWPGPSAQGGNKIPKTRAMLPVKGSEVRLRTYNKVTVCGCATSKTVPLGGVKVTNKLH